MLEGDDSFKRPGAVPFSWEVQPGVPKTRDPEPEYDPSFLLQPPKKLPPLRFKPFPPSDSSSPSSSSSFSHLKDRPASPFAPPPCFKLKPPPDSSSDSSGPPTPYFLSSSPPRARRDSGGALSRWRFPKSLFGLKKSKSGDLNNAGQESTSSESGHYYESETPSEDSSQGSIWSSPKSSFSSLRSSPMKRIQSDLSSYEKKRFQ